MGKYVLCSDFMLLNRRKSPLMMIMMIKMSVEGERDIQMSVTGNLNKNQNWNCIRKFQIFGHHCSRIKNTSEFSKLGLFLCIYLMILLTIYYCIQNVTKYFLSHEDMMKCKGFLEILCTSFMTACGQ
jgi:hypothetical protein